jgi:hypothetical protein
LSQKAVIQCAVETSTAISIRAFYPVLESKPSRRAAGNKNRLLGGGIFGRLVVVAEREEIRNGVVVWLLRFYNRRRRLLSRAAWARGGVEYEGKVSFGIDSEIEAEKDKNAGLWLFCHHHE